MVYRQVAHYEPHAAEESLVLQNHNDRVRYRNIWIAGFGLRSTREMIRSAILSLLALPLYGQNLDTFVKEAAAKTVTNFAPSLKPDQLAITVVDLADGTTASYRGDIPIYPASVVKLFYLVNAHAQMEMGTLTDTPELERALHDMIVDSSND